MSTTGIICGLTLHVHLTAIALVLFSSYTLLSALTISGRMGLLAGYIYNPGTRKVGAGRPEVKDHP